MFRCNLTGCCTVRYRYCTILYPKPSLINCCAPYPCTTIPMTTLFFSSRSSLLSSLLSLKDSDSTVQNRNTISHRPIGLPTPPIKIREGANYHQYSIPSRRKCPNPPSIASSPRVRGPTGMLFINNKNNKDGNLFRPKIHSPDYSIIIARTRLNYFHRER